VPEGWQVYENLSGEFTVALPGSWLILQEEADRVFFSSSPSGPVFGEVGFIREGASTMFGEDNEENVQTFVGQAAELWGSATGWRGFRVMDEGMRKGNVYKGYFCEYVLHNEQLLEVDWPAYNRKTMIVAGDSAVMVGYGHMYSEEFTEGDYDVMEAILRTVRVRR